VSGELPEQTAKGIPLTRQTDEATDSGLVICSKTDRDLEKSEFMSRADFEVLLSEFSRRKQSEESKASPFNFSIGFSPGSIRVSRSSSERRGKKPENWQPRGTNVAWSNKSRVKMLERFSTLDFNPFEDESSILAFLTLTYPSQWQIVAPTSASAKLHLLNLRKRFEREFKRPFFALWKMEFQRRGAPHFHLLAPIPKGSEFKNWLSRNWAEIVNHPDESERAKHLVAGTGVDKAKGTTADTAQRISYYFSKHSSANKGPKEYQNTPPEEWVASGSVGRFWGYWGLKIATATLEVSESDALFVARCLRRWQRANRKIVKVHVWRTNFRSGEIKKRSVRRRSKVVSSAFSFRLIPDGEKFAGLFSKFLTK